MHQMLTTRGGGVAGNFYLFLVQLYHFLIFYHEHLLILKPGVSIKQQKQN